MRHVIASVIALICLLANSTSAVAQDQNSANITNGSAYLAQIEVHTVAELFSVLQRVDTLFVEGDMQPGSNSPVAFILHGAEARALLSENYKQNKATVDLAARLSAFQIVDIKVCETWMEGQTLDPTMLPPFIGTVPNGPAAEQRLLEKQGYIYF